MVIKMNKHQLQKVIKESLYNILYESLQTQRQKYGDELVNKLKNIDPSKTYKYIDKICQFYKDGIDINKIKDYINKFDILQNKNIIQNKDINAYKTFDQLKQIVDSSSFETKSSIKKEVYNNPYKTIKNDKGIWYIYKPQTKEESILLGKHTKWCTQQKNRNMFNTYFWKYNIDFYYIININSGDKYQIQSYPNNKQELFDMEDNSISAEEFENRTSIDPTQFKWNKQLNGTYKIYFNDGNIYFEVTYKNNELNGQYKKYYNNGQVMIEATYKDGKLDGVYKEYNRNGSIEIEEVYKNNELNGPYKKYYRNGNLEIDTIYKNDKLNGEYKKYYRNGQIMYDIIYKDGERNGIYKEYYRDGNLEVDTIYKDDKLNGKYKEYYKNGNIWIDTIYKNDKKDGPYKEYDEDGELIDYLLYKNDHLVKDYLNGDEYE